jgi:hypothetical protein
MQPSSASTGTSGHRRSRHSGHSPEDRGRAGIPLQQPERLDVPNLDTLAANIKTALYYRNPSMLERYRAKENFFAMSRFQEISDQNARPNFDIGLFLTSARKIYYGSDFLVQNETEAVLHTWGWSYRIEDWYFYFRKVDYPADPQIHGNWEWAGIYFGDTL